MLRRTRCAPLSRRRTKSLRELLPHAVIVIDPKKLARLKAEAAKQKPAVRPPVNDNGARNGFGV
jgi:hypothetical protein